MCDRGPCLRVAFGFGDPPQGAGGQVADANQAGANQVADALIGRPAPRCHAPALF